MLEKQYELYNDVIRINRSKFNSLEKMSHYILTHLSSTNSKLIIVKVSLIIG